MTEPLIDLRALLVEREDFEGGMVGEAPRGAGPGRSAGPQPQGNLRHPPEAARRRRRTAAEEDPPQARRRRLLPRPHPHRGRAPEQGRRPARRVLPRPGPRHLGQARAYADDDGDKTDHYDAAYKAFDKAEKTGYAAQQVQLQKAGVLRLQGHTRRSQDDPRQAQGRRGAQRRVLLPGGRHRRGRGRPGPRRQVLRCGPSNSTRGTPAALFRLGFLNDLPGNDDEAIGFYERCLKYPPIGKGVLYNLGVLYEDNDQYDKAADCYRRLAQGRPARRAGQAVPQGRRSVAVDVLQPGGRAGQPAVPPGDGNPDHRLRAVGAQPELPEEDEHPHARRPDPRDRVATAGEQELRRDVARRDQESS